MIETSEKFLLTLLLFRTCFGISAQEVLKQAQDDVNSLGGKPCAISF